MLVNIYRRKCITSEHFCKCKTGGTAKECAHEYNNEIFFNRQKNHLTMKILLLSFDGIYGYGNLETQGNRNCHDN